MAHVNKKRVEGITESDGEDDSGSEESGEEEKGSIQQDALLSREIDSLNT